MKALILAGGCGKNLMPFTATRPKAMIKIAGRRILEDKISMLKESGLNNLYVVTGHAGETIPERLSGTDYGINISYLSQGDKKGIGGAVSLIKEKISPGEYFMLIYGDIITSENIVHYTLQSFNLAKGPVASVCLTQSTEMYGNVYLDEQMRVTKLVEKPKGGNLGNYILAGVYILPSEFIDILERNDNDMETALTELIDKVGLTASIWENDWLDLCYPWDILTANQTMMNGWNQAIVSDSVILKGEVKISGGVHIEAGVEIRSGTVIEGPCFIGQGSFIGNNCLIRKNSSIGQNCSIGYGVELKNAILFGNSTIGRLSYVGDSVIGRKVNIGAGTMTVNNNLDNTTIKREINGKEIDSGLNKLGAFVGDNSIIGAGHTLKAGTIIDSDITIPHNYSYPTE
ncbi:MAG: NTP transferase domain-containing protein [Nitrospinae bacterium]|nr:NTP transferase domain-containing protein [Nitrospinota bacterium]